MDSTNLKLILTANSINAATWGFHYYLKYYCNSSVYWSGNKINIYQFLPKVPEKIRITANDQYYNEIILYLVKLFIIFKRPVLSKCMHLQLYLRLVGLGKFNFLIYTL